MSPPPPPVRSAINSSHPNTPATSDHPLISPDESDIDQLLATEPDYLPKSDYSLRCHRHSIDTTARQNSINWILKVHRHFNFRPVTAILAVNYFDRFLSTNSLPAKWLFQLLSVACLALAAKMEEPLFPLLTDLQVFNVRPIIFHPRTVQRMEILVMSKLNWRLHSITPFDYLHYFISNLHPFVNHSSSKLFSDASTLILKSIPVIGFLPFSPSVIAAAAVITAVGNDFDTPEGYYEKVNEEMVRSCNQLMEDHLIDTCPFADRIQGPPPPPPLSPVGVLDAATDCASCVAAASRLSSDTWNGDGEPSNKSPQSPTADVQEEQP